MKGDFSRNTFDPQRHFSRILMQQGRVQLDADWNEQASINLHYLRTLNVDLVGPHWGPVGHFKVGPITTAGDIFTVAPGHYYVNGILCENVVAQAYTKQASFPLLESERNPTGTFLAYLDVWERHITWLDEASIREVALGGPDTTTRAQITWQVKLAPAANARDRAAAEKLVNDLRTRKMPALLARAKRDTAQTNLCVIPPESRYRGAENQLYRVEIHQVARNADGTITGATFKWSRDNGSIVFPVTSVQKAGDDVVVNVAHLGRDDISTLAENDMVELVDDASALRNLAEPIGRVKKIDRAALLVTIEVSDPNPLLTKTGHMMLRRWDHEGDLAAASEGALPVVEANAPGGTNRWLALEDGIEIQFVDGGDYHTGDYWMIPARTATGDVEWPVDLDANGAPKRDADGNTTPLPVEPAGIAHYYAPLAIVTIAANGTSLVTDCRNEIKPITSAPS